MTEVHDHAKEVGELLVLLKGEVVVEREALNRYACKKALDERIDCSGRSVGAVHDERIPGLAFHQHEQRAMTVLAALDEVTLNMAELLAILDMLGSLLNTGTAVHDRLPSALGATLPLHPLAIQVLLELSAMHRIHEGVYRLGGDLRQPLLHFFNAPRYHLGRPVEG